MDVLTSVGYPSFFVAMEKTDKKVWWGVWDREDGVHVAPCDKGRCLIHGHTLSRRCYCSPSMIKDITMSKPIWEHRDAS